jgi:transporter family protein
LVWALVVARGETPALKNASAQSFIFLALSALATGVSWLAYFRALQLAPASHVAPIDKLSLPLTIALAVLALGEPLTLKLGCGVALMVVGAMLTVV